MKTNIFFSTLIFGLLAACSTQESKTEQITPTPSAEVIPNEVDQLILDIDANETNMSIAYSLLYTKEDNTMTEAKVYFDKNDVVAKIADTYLEGTTGMVTRTSFYFNGGVKFASRVAQELKNDKGKPYFSEKITFYDKKGNPTSSKERKADFEELLENETFQKIEIVKMDETLALQKINKEEDFAVTFQGFVDSGPYSFLIVGENKPNGYSSSLSIQTQHPTINYLKNKGKAELGRPLAIEFEKIIDNQGYEMQVLMDVKLIEQAK